MTVEIIEESLPFEETNARRIERTILEGVGAASACWDNLEGAGVFQSERALEIGGDLARMMRDMLFAYSEWLDANQGLFRKPKYGDNRTHAGLINEWLQVGAASE